MYYCLYNVVYDMLFLYKYFYYLVKIKYCVNTIEFTMLVRKQCRLNVYSTIEK